MRVTGARTIQYAGEMVKMISKRRYLLLTAALLLLSIGTGFAMQQRQHRPVQAALQALQTANFQLGRDSTLADGHRLHGLMGRQIMLKCDHRVIGEVISG